MDAAVGVSVPLIAVLLLAQALIPFVKWVLSRKVEKPAADAVAEARLSDSVERIERKSVATHDAVSAMSNALLSLQTTMEHNTRAIEALTRSYRRVTPPENILPVHGSSQG